MANIRVDSAVSLYDGQTITFRSPADCSEVTGLIVYYPDRLETVSKVFQLTDAHGENVGNIDHLFASDAIVKVVMDVENLKAYVQNADTNAYLEAQLANKAPNGFGLGDKCAIATDGDWNNALHNGWFSGKLNAPDSGWWFGTVSLLNDQASILQEASRQFTSIDFTANMVNVQRRGLFSSDGLSVTWGEWEYFNPPMQPNIVYRTVYRYHGKPVYVKADSNGIHYWKTNDDTTWHTYLEMFGAADGGYGKGTKQDGIKKNYAMTTKGWYRICSGHYECDAIININQRWSSGLPSELLLYVSFNEYAQKLVCMQYGTHLLNLPLIRDARLVKHGDKTISLDVYYDGNVGNDPLFNIINTGRYEMTFSDAPTLVSANDTLPEGETLHCKMEWQNPPLHPDVEYPTPTRIAGKAVYMKNIDGVVNYRLQDSTVWKPIADIMGAGATQGLELSTMGNALSRVVTGTTYNDNTTGGGIRFGIKYLDANEPECGVGTMRGTNNTGIFAQCDYTNEADQTALGFRGFITKAVSGNTRQPASLMIDIASNRLMYYQAKQKKVYAKNEQVQMNEYEVLHTGNGGARIQTGSYVGTGTYGVDNPIELTFNFPPKKITIAIDEQGLKSHSFCRQVTLIYGQTIVPAGFDDSSSSGQGNNNLRVSGWGTNKIKFYLDTTEQSNYVPFQQMNASGRSYYYCGEG